MKLGVLCLIPLGLLVGCGSDRVYSDSTRPSDSSTPVRDATPESRILSVLHAKNQEEIELGSLAAQKGSSIQARRFGESLVRHHRELDDEVRQVASDARMSLMGLDETKRLLAREKGVSTLPSPADELRPLQGDAFDRAFAQKMVDGHRDLIRTVEESRANVTDPKVRGLLDRTLPTLREHEQMALDLRN